MKLGLLSDAHGNFLGTKKCLDFLKSRMVDHICFLGDTVGYYPDAKETLDALIESRATMLLGNHDAMMLGYLDCDDSSECIYRLERSRALMGDGHLRLLSQMPPKLDFEFDGRNLLLVHGSPRDPLLEYVYPDSDLTAFQHLKYDSVFMGHTHRPFISGIAVNVGSCGLPRDIGNLLSCCIYDSEKNEAQIFRIPIDRGLLRKEYASEVHSTVMGCLDRDADEYYGILINE